MPTYTVEQGDTLSSIAEKFTFAKWETIWNDGNNAALKALRKNPRVLYPGDSVYVPEKTEKSDSAPTAKYSKFEVKMAKLKLRLLLKDINDMPFVSQKLTLTAADAVAAMTDGDGKAMLKIKRDAIDGNLMLTGVFEGPLKIGYLDPVSEKSGQVARLNNLGYFAEEPDNPDDGDVFRSAVEEFQCDNGLPVTGDCDDATQAQLEAAHGC